MKSLLNPIPVDYAIELLKLEANAIHRTAEHLKPAQLEQALTLLQTCQGKLVLAGVGKSGIVAQKIAATLNSIGTVAVYLHPCDALHGDLGIVTADDVLMVLSNSGETEELIAMMPHLKYRKVPVIAIVGNPDSTIAHQADVVLDAAVDREACPLNLAPTTSTTVALAIGDALAMTLMHLRGITAEEFAVNHPAGRLGKRLTLRVRDLILQNSEQLTLLPDASWIEVVTLISQGGAGAVNVVDSQGRLLGVITDGDLRRWVLKTKTSQLEQLTAQKIMTPNPITVTADVLAYDALQLMENRASQIAVLPVVDQYQMCLGLVRLHDLVGRGL